MEELIKKAIMGDKDAFTTIIKNIEKDLYRIAFTRLKNNDDVADAIQNTMIIVFENLRKLRKIEFFKTWVIKILINECNKIYRNNSKNRVIKEKISENNSSNLTTYNIEKIDDWNDFNKIILRLNSEEQLIFTLYYKDKYSCEEISKIIKMKKNTVKSKLTRGREKIKKFLEEVKKHENI